MEWNGMESWNGIMEWVFGMEYGMEILDLLEIFIFIFPVVL